ncbi:MAG: AAA family ATPase [Pseudomonadales bacterium]
MAHHLHIFGASGSGTSTLGAHLARAIDGAHLDTDAYYWQPTEPPFTHKREPTERVSLIERDLRDQEHWVLSGSLCSWGEPLLHHFTLAVFLFLDPAVRMQRLADRERAHYGSRIDPGGDMCAQHLEFMRWAASYDHSRAPMRSLDLHERWMSELSCPVVRLDSGQPLAQLCNSVLARLAG